MTCRFLLSALLLLSSGNACALEYSLRSLHPTYVDGSTGIVSVIAGHFDGDRRVDMALCFRNRYVNFYTQDATGEQVLRRQEVLWVQDPPPRTEGEVLLIYRCRMHLLDLDANGIDDLIVTHSQGTLVLKLFSDGSVQRQEYARTGIGFSGGDGFIDSVVADFDGDGDMDLVGIRWLGVVSQLTNQGDGHLSHSVDVGVVLNGTRLAVGDLDGDGRPDLAVVASSEQGGSTAILHNDGRGRLVERAGTRLRHPPGYWFERLEVGDVTGDGKDDLVLVNVANAPKGVLLVHEQGGDGTLMPHVSYPTYEIPEHLAIQDLDGDGRNDIVLLHPSWTSLTSYLQRSDGFLDIHGIVRSIPSPQDGYNALALGDFRGDGCKDVLVATSHYSWIDGTGCLPASNADVAASVLVNDTSTSLQVENRDPAVAAHAVIATLRLDSVGVATFFPPAPEGCTVSAANRKARVYVCRIGRLEPGETRTYTLGYSHKSVPKGRYGVIAVARVSSHGDEAHMENNLDQRSFWRVSRAPAVHVAPPGAPPTAIPPGPAQVRVSPAAPSQVVDRKKVLAQGRASR